MRSQADLSLFGHVQGQSSPIAQLPSSVQLNAASLPGLITGCRGGSWKWGEVGAGEESAERGREARPGEGFCRRRAGARRWWLPGVASVQMLTFFSSED